MLNINRTLALLSLCTVALSNIVFALPDDRKQPIQISADTAELNEQTGTAVYAGNVIMTQGSMQMKANKVELVRKNDDIDSIIATGTPASFQQKPAANKPITTAYGMKMVYKIKDQTITITDKAKVVQEKDSFSGERIVYQMDKAIVNAYGGNGSSGERVQMIIQPKAK